MEYTMEVLLCRPAYFDVTEHDAENTHMNPNNRPNVRRACRQHDVLLELYKMLGLHTSFIPARHDLPDMTFVANSGFNYTHNGQRYFLLSNFKPKRRRGEREHHFVFFRNRGYGIRILPQHIFFEGSGDVLWYKDMLMLGYGFRSCKDAIPWMEKFTERKVVPIRLKSPGNGKHNPYHLDTAIIPLPEADTVIAYTEGIEAKSLRALEKVANVLPAKEKDAQNLALNALVVPYSDLRVSPSLTKRSPIGAAMLSSKNASGEYPHGAVITTSAASVGLKQMLLRCGYVPFTSDMSEFIKSGAGVFCLTKVL